ncbi:UDP-glycosyltransferase 73B3-like [Syzygium oleosum]|uniref:UDP-glycosyltransferase 73B3-like n=1 Tax=Syzygium oleosum TaxID=219896 RepID=UPI0011D1BEEC|nr:UDP-glycosyltransferase 73B3-like [Syzygium oleosum]
MAGGEIWVLPAFGQGHLFPCIELCKLVTSRNRKATLVVSSILSSSVPSTFHDHPLTDVIVVPADPPRGGSDGIQLHMERGKAQLADFLKELLTARLGSSTWPVCAVLDVLVISGWAAEVFDKFGVRTVGFFTSGGCSAAMDLAAWKGSPLDIEPGETRLLPGLPEEMGLTVSDLKRRTSVARLRKWGQQQGHGAGSDTGPGSSRPLGLGGPPRMPGEKPYWVDPTESSIALVINTCHDLEGPFLDYLANQVGKPVWGVGPLLPDQYWMSSGSLVRDREIRPSKQSNVTEEDVIRWLDSKPRGSVIYVSFGSSVGLTTEEYDTLAKALEGSAWPFIWAIQPGSGGSREGYYPNGLEAKVRERALIITGWAPQLLILSHSSTGGFLSHCGWNSTVEALGRGVPFLAWPIRGDQFYNAKLVAHHLKVGYRVSDDDLVMVKKEEIVKGIDKLMSDEEVKERAAKVSGMFQGGFPASAVADLDAFINFLT